MNYIIDILQNITSGGIYRGPKNSIYIRTGPAITDTAAYIKVFEDRLDGQYIEYQSGDVESIFYDVPDYERGIDMHLHRFMHSINFNDASNSKSILEYNSRENDDYYKIEQGITDKDLQLNTVMSYSNREGNRINSAYFDYILDTKKPIFSKLPQNIRDSLNEIVNNPKYRAGLEIGMTFFDMCDIEKQFSKEENSSYLENMIKKIGPKNLMFKQKSWGEVIYLGTGDTISVQDTEEYCPKLNIKLKSPCETMNTVTYREFILIAEIILITLMFGLSVYSSRQNTQAFGETLTDIITNQEADIVIEHIRRFQLGLVDFIMRRANQEENKEERKEENNNIHQVDDIEMSLVSIKSVDMLINENHSRVNTVIERDELASGEYNRPNFS